MQKYDGVNKQVLKSMN